MLEFLAAEGEESFWFIASGEAFFCDGGFAVGDEGDASLVLMEFVALVFHVQDGSDGRSKLALFEGDEWAYRSCAEILCELDVLPMSRSSWLGPQFMRI